MFTQDIVKRLRDRHAIHERKVVLHDCSCHLSLFPNLLRLLSLETLDIMPHPFESISLRQLPRGTSRSSNRPTTSPAPHLPSQPYPVRSHGNEVAHRQGIHHPGCLRHLNDPVGLRTPNTQLQTSNYNRVDLWTSRCLDGLAASTRRVHVSQLG